jgi:DNA-binding IclR family transcriptional regulator
VLLEVARAPDATVREVAERVGLTERQTHRVLSDLVEARYVKRTREGRRNRYQVNRSLPMRHRSVRAFRIGELLAVLDK